MIVAMIGLAVAAMASLIFSTLTFALRDFSRARLEDALARHGRSDWLSTIIDKRSDLVFVTAIARLIANISIVITSALLFAGHGLPPWARILPTFILATAVSLFVAVAIPTALAMYLGESALAVSVPALAAMRIVLLPLTTIMHWVDALVRRLAGPQSEPEPEQIEKDILTVVEEGEKEGVVNTQEREMIESVIEFHDTTVDQIMTGRPNIVALEVNASLEDIRQLIVETGHSRLPVYDGTLDHVVGILYAHDLLKHLGGQSPREFDIRAVMRPVTFVPETKPLRNLLRNFKAQKVHIAIVLDEYGGTAGLITIEDILEELVGEITDEHEPHEPAMLRRIDNNTFDVNARLFVNEINRQCGLNLPEDAGFDTLGGFISFTLGRIPPAGTSFEQGGVKYTVLDAEPQRVKRVKVEVGAK